MLLSEAKEILEKNGYRLTEVYDAVTDHMMAKERRARYIGGYNEDVIKRLKTALNEEGVRCSIADESGMAHSGRWVLTFADGSMVSVKKKYRDHYDVRSRGSWKNEYGPESGEKSAWERADNKITLQILKDGDTIDTADFDPRNIPSMVEWIFDNVEL